MKTRKSYFYIQVINKKDEYPVYYGYSDNEWLATQFAKSIMDNKLLNVGVDSEIFTFNYFGTLDEFHEEIRKTFKVVITGEDIIDTFPTNMDYNTIPIADGNVVSTCSNVLGGGFAEYAERFLLPVDRSHLIEAIDFLVQCGIRFIKDDIDHDITSILIDAIDVIYNQNMIQSGTPFLNYGDSGMDVVRYGIMKGWYTII